MPFGLQPWHLIVIAVVALLVFGPSRLPEIGRGMGRTLSQFRQGTKDMTEAFHEELKTDRGAPSSSVVSSSAPSATQTTISSTSASPAVLAGGSTLSGVYCNQCGTANPAGARFCGKCGSPLAM